MDKETCNKIEKKDVTVHDQIEDVVGNSLIEPNISIVMEVLR